MKQLTEKEENLLNDMINFYMFEGISLSEDILEEIDNNKKNNYNKFVKTTLIQRRKNHK